MAPLGLHESAVGNGGSRLKALLIPLYLLASLVGLLLPPRPSYSWWGTSPKYPDVLDTFYLQYRCMISGIQPGDCIRVQKMIGADEWYTVNPGGNLLGADWIRGQGITALDGQPHLLTSKFKFCACICGCYYYHLRCGTIEVSPGVWNCYFVTRGTCMGFVPDC
jgi:hypothetical protein